MVSNYRLPDCWINSLFRIRTMKSAKLRFIGRLWGKSQCGRRFPTQGISDAGMFPRHDVIMSPGLFNNTTMHCTDIMWKKVSIFLAANRLVIFSLKSGTIIALIWYLQNAVFWWWICCRLPNDSLGTCKSSDIFAFCLLHWRHNDHVAVSNHQPHDCLLNRLFRRRSKKTSKLHVTGLCAGNSPGPVNSPHKGQVTRKMFHLTTSSC